MLKAILLTAIVCLLAAPAQAHHDKAQGYRAKNTAIIMHVFGPKYGPQAVRVAECESGLTTWAVNGQYVNLFQMGYWERKNYGWHERGSSAWQASKAALRYFRATGRTWGPWTCKPW